MTAIAHLAYAEAYTIKASAGGGFRGVALNKLTSAQFKGERRDTLEAAKVDAKAAVFDWAAERNMTNGTYRSRPGLWRCNYFIRADEIDASEHAAKAA